MKTKYTTNCPVDVVIHIGGGVRAVSVGNNTIELYPNTFCRKITKFEVDYFEDTFPVLQQFELSVIGVDFITNEYEATGKAPPQWRCYLPSNIARSISEDTSQRWRGIAHSAFKQDKGHVWDLSNRIGYQIKVCSWRVRELSESYHQQINAKILQNDYTSGEKFEDGYTWQMYMSIQSYLVDAAILRDYLAEFSAAFIFGDRYKIDGSRISTHSKLIKLLKETSISDPLADELLEFSREDGWIKGLGEYRNLVVHSTPLAYAENQQWAYIKSKTVGMGRSIPTIEISLPNNPGDISSRRASRKHFSNFEEQCNKFFRLDGVGENGIDALSYAHQTHHNLTKLALKLSHESPVKYQEIVITDEDIIGTPTITRTSD